MFYYSFGKGTASTGNSLPGIRNILGIINQGNILDLGIGYGRNSLFLLNEGEFRACTGVDLDNNALTYCSNVMTIPTGKKLHLVEGDIRSYSISRKYEVIICALVLNYFNESEVQELIKKIQFYTVKGGVNYIAVYVDVRLLENKNYKKIFAPFELTHNFYNEGWEVRNDLSKNSFSAKINSLTFEFTAAYYIFQKE